MGSPTPEPFFSLSLACQRERVGCRHLSVPRVPAQEPTGRRTPPTCLQPRHSVSGLHHPLTPASAGWSQCQLPALAPCQALS